MTSSPRTTKRIVATLTMLVVLVGLFSAAFIWQLTRALAGNNLSWAYVVEWPFLIGYACYFAYRDLSGAENVQHTRNARDLATSQKEEAAMTSYNEYLSQLSPKQKP